MEIKKRNNTIICYGSVVLISYWIDTTWNIDLLKLIDWMKAQFWVISLLCVFYSVFYRQVCSVTGTQNFFTEIVRHFYKKGAVDEAKLHMPCKLWLNKAMNSQIVHSRAVKKVTLKFNLYFFDPVTKTEFQTQVKNINVNGLLAKWFLSTGSSFMCIAILFSQYCGLGA